MSSGQGVEFPDGFVSCVAEEVEATGTFDSDDFIFLECTAHIAELFCVIRKIKRFSVFIKGKLGATGRTGDRLGMEAPIGRVFVFLLAVWAHREIAHGRGRAIVGTRFRYSEARSTESAGEEKITTSPVFRIGKFREAVVAEEEIRRDFSVSIARTFEYSESGRRPPVDVFSAYRVDAHVIRKSGQDLLECFRVIDDRFDSVACIPYRSGYAGPDAGITNEGSESDSLDDADDGETGKSLSHIFFITIPMPRPTGKGSYLS